jgi:hypothetical protein
MWRTQEGDRVLRGEEATLFQQGLSNLVFYITGFGLDEDDESDTDDWDVGVRVFDALSRHEKLGILEHVAHALLVKSVKWPPLTAVGEGAVAAVYYHLLGDVETEIDEGGTGSRQLMLAAATECDLDDDLPALDSGEFEEWRDVVELLMDRILWDRDWEEEFVKLDDPPEVARQVRDFVRIDPDLLHGCSTRPKPGTTKAH